jgi:hypothetical protein
MLRIVRLSALAACSMALVSLGLAGCDSRPADGTQVQVDEVARKEAIDKMRSVMESPKGPMAARKASKAGRGLH